MEINASTAGDDIQLLVGDQDLIGAGTVSVVVSNPRSGESETVTLIESSIQPGNFTGALSSAVDAASDGSGSNGSINVLAGDDVTALYDDLINANGIFQSVKDTDVIGGTDGIPQVVMSTAGQPAQLTVADLDLTGTGTLDVTVINQTTGESEVVTLAETGIGQFTFDLPTIDAIGANPTAGIMNVQPLDVIRIDYADALRADGTAITVSDTDSVREGTPAFVSINATTVGQAVGVTVTDGDRSGQGSATVTIANMDTGETEVALLSEVSGNPGTFTGTVATQFGTTASLNTSDGIFNADHNDVFQVSYDDLARPLGSPPTITNTALISGGNTGTPTISATLVGALLPLQVSDLDLAGSATLFVDVLNGSTGGVETVSLLETGPATGIFQASLPTVFGTTPDGSGSNGSINAANGDTFTISYSDTLRDDGSTGVETASASIGGGATGTPVITATTVGSDLALQISDADLTGAGTIVVIVDNAATGETETVTLTETTPGVFAAPLPTTFGTTTDGSGSNGSINAANGDTFTTTYTDILQADGSSGTVIANAVISGGVTGIPLITATAINQPLGLGVTDTDLIGAGTLVVAVANATTSGVETVTLAEDTTTPGTFSTTLQTAFGTASDGDTTNGSINGANGDIFTITYTDALQADGSSGPQTATTTITGGATGIPTISATTVGAVLSLQVSDPDITGAASITVDFSNGTTGGSETVTLTEATPGIFSATLQTAFGTASDGDTTNGSINGANGDIFTITYTDTLQADGSSGPQTAIATITGGITGIPTISATTVGAVLSLQVSDPDITGAASITVDVSNGTTGGSETVTLTEATPGIFSATLQTAFGTASDGDTTNGSINAANGDIFTITYTDALQADGSGGPQTAATTITGGATGVPAISATTVNQPITLTVSDSDITGTGAISVNVSNPATGEVETVTINETTPGVFQGSINTTFGTVSDGSNTNGTVNVVAGQSLVLTYIDALAIDGSEQLVSASAAPAGGTSGAPEIVTTTIGAPIQVVVTDPDVTGSGSLDVNVTTSNSGEVEIVTLSESEPGIFTGALSSAPGSTPDGDPSNRSINVTTADTVIITYQDSLIPDGSASSISAETGISGGANAVANIVGTTPNQPLAIMVIDLDLIGQESISATITNLINGEIEPVVLTADPDDPEIFTANLPTNFGAVTDGPPTNGSLTVQANDTVEVSYTDPFGSTGELVSVTNSTQITGGTTGLITGTSALIGEPVPITVMDADLVGEGSIEVTITSPSSNDIETITLIEVPQNTGTFTGTVSTALTSFENTQSNGILATNPAEYILITYVDELLNDGSTAPVSGTVTMLNRTPIVANDSISAPPGIAVAIPVLVNDSDPDGTPLLINSITQPTTGGVVTFSPVGTVVFEPTAGFIGPVEFTYTAGDQHGLSATATVTVNVNGIAPTAVADLASTAPNTPVTITVLLNDVEPGEQPLQIQSIGQPTNGTAVITPAGTIIYTPNTDFIGPDSFSYTVVNDAGLTDTATVGLSVKPSIPEVNDDPVSTPNDTPIVVSVLDNDVDLDGGTLTVQSITQPGNGTATLNLNGTISYVPNEGFTGTEIFTYLACTTNGACAPGIITLTVEPPLANITGIVFEDFDHDRIRDPGEPLLTHWVVELQRNGETIAATATDENGRYVIENIFPRPDYDVVFIHPNTGVVWSKLENIALPAGTTVIDQNLPIDPSGVVYDVLTRLPVSGINLNLTSAAGIPLPTICFVDPSQQNQTTAADGRYRFDIVPNASPACPAVETEYRISLSNGGAPITPSNAISPEPAPLDPTGTPSPFAVVTNATAPQLGDPTTYYISFLLEAGDPNVVNNHIPVGLSTRLDLVENKTAARRLVSVGELVPYTITILNGDAANRPNLSIIDILPEGFSYKFGSGAIDGLSIEPQVIGNRLSWNGVTIPANGQVTVTLIAVAGSRVTIGDHTNQAFAFNPLTLAQVSNTATATVSNEGDPDFYCATIIGRVFEDRNGDGRVDRNEPGLKGVRLATVKGTLIKTGKHGRYHLPCPIEPNAKIGSNFVVKIDERTIPRGYKLVSRNPQMVRLTRGKITKVNFTVQRMAEVALAISSGVFRPNSTRLSQKYADGIKQIIQALEENPGSLALTYHASPEERKIARKRLKAVQIAIEDAWRKRGRPYDLSIERTIEIKR